MQLQRLLRPLPLRLAPCPSYRVSLIRSMSVFSSARLQDRVVLVTGASAGIGAVSALAGVGRGTKSLVLKYPTLC